LYRLVVHGVEDLILLGAFFLPCVSPVSQPDFWFTELTPCDSALYLPSWSQIFGFLITLLSSVHILIEIINFDPNFIIFYLLLFFFSKFFFSF
jgi:hypothetical protein